MFFVIDFNVEFKVIVLLFFIVSCLWILYFFVGLFV